jgi:hypothetical protein
MFVLSTKFLNYTFNLSTNWLATATLSTFNQKLGKKIDFQLQFPFFCTVFTYAYYSMASRLCQHSAAMHLEATTLALPDASALISLLTALMK